MDGEIKWEIKEQQDMGERERKKSVWMLQLVINKADYDLSITLTRALSFDIHPSLSPWIQKAAAQPWTLHWIKLIED